MRSDAFSKRHPAVNFAFFLGAICAAVIIQHPAYLAVGIFFSTGEKGFGTFFLCCPFSWC